MTLDSNTSGEILVDRLLGTLVGSSFDTGKEFWPHGRIRELVTPETITNELAEDVDQIPLRTLVDFITHGSRRVFAIVLCCDFEGQTLFRAMSYFMRLNFNDSNLPVRGDQVKHIFFSSTGKPRDPWSRLAVRNFELYQWKCIAPVFNTNDRELALYREHVLPFTWSNHQGASGMFGDVHEVTIHPAHRSHQDNVAVKKLHRVPTEDQAKLRELEMEWQKEVEAHKAIAEFNHSNIIKFMTAITRDHERFLMFEWADGGNLREFWRRNRKTLTASLVKDILIQLRGLVDALENIHAKGYRHGDMKPENILRFKARGSDSAIGTLKICDMGLTKYHYLATQLRQQGTDTKFTTFRYEPPESADENKAWSRRYDTWSMGCIILEFIVWMVYGTDQLNTFNDKIVNEFNKPCHYFMMEKRHGEVSTRVHDVASKMMDSLAQRAECQAGKTALGDLLQIVRTRLLVVRLGPPTFGRGNQLQFDTNAQNQRADARTLNAKLDAIIERGNQDPSYWVKGETDDDLPSLRTPKAMSYEPPAQGFLSVARKRSSGSVGGVLTSDRPSLVVPILTGSVGVQLNDIWEFHVDNNFATGIINKIIASQAGPNMTGPSQLCDKCRRLEFSMPRFSIADGWDSLEDCSRTCDFCRMRWEICSQLDREDCPIIRFERDQSTLKLSGRYPPVMSIRRGFEVQRNRVSHIQIGRPQLFNSGSQAHFEFLRQCLNDCNSNHPECRLQKLGPLPTRLIHLGSKDSSGITLYTTQPADKVDYAALSHPWGKGPHFCTTWENIEAHRNGIPFEKLPIMFQDAVVTTRNLGLEYLWIDSICIIQGPGGDFDQEAKLMEDVFSSAFCVIAASSAHGQNDSFLDRPSQHIECVTFEKPGLPPIYVSRFIDDFNTDVLQAPLSQRGWVLQERVLARRTFYFTDRQTYWECGRGIRCETMTKMDNKLASFLGDPNFPSKLSKDARVAKIQLYEDLYRKYTRLQFTCISDRPIAITGLERRLIRDLKVQGGFGVFDDGRSLLQRSLLWQRGQGLPPMVKIPSNPSLPVPSWSWMGYDGGIDFLDLPLGGVEWLTGAIKSPWATGGANTWHTGDGKEFVELEAWAWRLKLGDVRLASHEELELMCDTQDEADWKAEDLMCVVAGMEKRKCEIGERVHFVLVIKRSREPLGPRGAVFERFGVGQIKGKYIDQTTPREAVVIR